MTKKEIKACIKCGSLDITPQGGAFTGATGYKCEKCGNIAPAAFVLNSLKDYKKFLKLKQKMGVKTT